MTHPSRPQGRIAQACLMLFTCAALNTMAHAADNSKSDIKLSGQVSVVSDYVWRGMSQTWGKGAAQINFTADHSSGAYFGFFASNVAAQYVPNGSLETDWSLGYKASLKGIDLDVGGVYVVSDPSSTS